ncbi:protein ALTERED PHOSPHATE STARVATION RESPONSE 1 isoform X2 [Lycium ferocissimum]|uniref:protein ALTERED PHOSPHATE STARVATION RESPONSE 1 isoform X2 n=1 Tax=Lycium ferocissimum TaxID=112874 RepID=UPI002814AD3B|nr:protein ALTERED PHOSPHATE STARVATION RESPONSE 1 isoform X2 [Lycium ferocissimum]
MGCTQSKIENEETVTRCKERKHFMKEAVSSRNAFAAAHSSYTMSLKNTGAALSDYAHGEVQFPSTVADTGAAVNAVNPAVAPPLSSAPLDMPPPPPLPFTNPTNFPLSPLQRAATMPEIPIPKTEPKRSDIIEEEEDEDEDMDTESTHNLKHRSSKSSGGGGGGGIGGRGSASHRQGIEDDELPMPTPPSLPRPQQNNRTPPPPPPSDSKGMASMSWDFFFPSMENVPGSTLAEEDESRIQRDELERRMMQERTNRNENDVRADETERVRKNEMPEVAGVVETVAEPPSQPPPPPQAATKVGKGVKNVVPGESKKKGGGQFNLLQIFSELDDCFLKASESAHGISKMLEANRLHYHSNFADNRGHIDHSARVMRVITWNRSFRGLQNADDGVDDFDSEEHETHATVLDKMLAWEKKLYDEVKAGEQMKLEYQRKVASLNKLKKRGTNTESLERVKATVSHLHTRYIVDMQSMDSTVSEINRLRDEQLYPKLVALVEGMAIMWESMRGYHVSQSKIVQALTYLDVSQSPKETTEHHHERTWQLYVVVQEWHSQFDKLVIYQKQYIKALNNWLKLNLIPIDTNLKEKVSSPQRPQNPPILALIHAWHDYLEKLPDELARTAIYNFSAVIHTIFEYQKEEIKLKDRCEETRRELNKKTRQYEDWYHKHMQRKMPSDEMDPEGLQDDSLVVDRQLQLEALRKRLEDEEDAYQRQCRQVRDKSLTSLRSRLPELFAAMSEYSLACADMYRDLRSISKHRNRNGNT